MGKKDRTGDGPFFLYFRKEKKMRKINLNAVGRWLKKNSPIILSVAGSGGVVLTAVLSGKAALKAKALGIVHIEEQKTDSDANIPDLYTLGADFYYFDNKKVAAVINKPFLTVKDKIKIFAPPVVSGALTVAAITGSAILGRKQYNSLAAACMMLGESYRNYQKKNIEINGKDAHEKVMDAIAAEAAKRQRITAATFGEVCSLTSEDDGEEEQLFYDYFSNRYFTSTLAAVMEAEYHINRNLCLGANVSVNDFYKFLGIDPIKGGDDLTWEYMLYDGMSWIDFDNRKTVFDDGLTCYIITMAFQPVECCAGGACYECGSEACPVDGRIKV